jgi:hypothetical protein
MVRERARFFGYEAMPRCPQLNSLSRSFCGRDVRRTLGRSKHGRSVRSLWRSQQPSKTDRCFEQRPSARTGPVPLNLNFVTL